MRFTAPLVLLLLPLLLALVAWLGWPSRGTSRRRETLSLILRVVICLCLVLALAGLEIVRASDRLAVVFLLDVSDSVPPGAQQAGLDFARQAMAGMGPDDQAALVAFGGEALVERAMSPGNALGNLASQPDAGQTDLSEAIRLGSALFPPDAAKRMVILSDGLSTTSDPLPAAQVAQAGGAQILTVPLGGAPESEALVTAVDAPEFLQQGERFDLQFTVSASEATQAGVRVLADGQVIFEGTQSLKAGEQSYSLPLTAGKTGFTRYQVQIEPQDDTWYQNNGLSTFSQVSGPPRVLIVAPQAGELLRDGSARPDEAAQLEAALRGANITVERVEPTGLPSDLVNLAPYASVVLVDVPARQLNERQMLTLQSFVRDLGGGLLAVGGPTSYGVGGYFRTPLEETLPVDIQIKDEKRRPTLSMVFIIDRSGSMTETSGGPTKLELAKEAAIRSVELLMPFDRVGVIAFDESATWVVPMTELTNLGGVQESIGTLRPGGGTDIMAGVQAMADVLPGDPGSAKHVILLTDGGADPTGIAELIQQLHDDNGITVTTVAVGNDAAPFLPELAEAGGGNFHFVNDPATIPSIFTEETSLATRSYIVERSFYPKQANPSPVLSGITSIPPLQGYVGTSIKDTAQAVLVSDLNDPILATWQYGLGRAAAFTSDATGRWAKQWVDWQGFAAFWAQATRYTMRDRAPSSLDVQVTQQGDGTAQIVVDAQRESGELLNSYTLEARVVGPDGEPQTVQLQQVAPGRYAANFTPGESGAYLFGVSGAPQGSTEGEGAVGETAGWAFSYSPEYSQRTTDYRALEKIAALSGRLPLELEKDAAEIFRHNLPTARATQTVWPWLLGLAALLLPLDVAVRRLLIGPQDVRRWWARLARRPVREVAPVARSERMSSLLEAKQRAEVPRSEGPGAEPAPPLVAPRPALEREKGRSDPEAGQPAAPAPREAVRPEAPSPKPVQPAEKPDQGGASTVGNLLKEKRERRKG